MLFNSYEYLLAFLPATATVYFLLNHFGRPSAAKVWLVTASLAFYSWWGLAYLPLIVISILINYSVGTALGSLHMPPVLRHTLLTAGLAFNLGLLGYFKYANFFVDNLNTLSGFDIGLARIALPLAISFFTFQKIAYLVDSYRGETVGYSFLNYALFVTFFPQLIAGPIVHHKEVVPQFADKRNGALDFRRITAGLCILSLGLFKKVMLADSFAPLANWGFDTADSLTFIEAWTTSLSYTFQLYFDFSGYTDMAIGSAMMFNIRLPINFNSPYKALNIQDFWHRWHITLSRFLRDYVYIPLGGNRHSEIRTYLNLFLTFLIGGLWHGASWMFVVWGAAHGLAIVAHRAWRKTGFVIPTPLAWLLTFGFVNLTWVFFRAKDVPSALKVLTGMVSIRDGSFSSLVHNGAGLSITVPLVGILLALCCVLLLKPTLEAVDSRTRLSSLSAACGIVFAVSLWQILGQTTATSEFLYFNF